jgi:hypothetical protein
MSKRKMPMRWLIVLLAGLGLAGCATVPTAFMPTDPIPLKEFSHHTFDELLKAHVHEGVVDYPGFQSDGRLDRYLAHLDRVDPNGFASREDRLAFWINAYNAFAIKGIIDRYSPLTLVGRYRYFIGRDYRVGGRTINLYDLERKVIIPLFHEPRIHFAIVCASASCPRLQPWAYGGDRLDEQLDSGARAFINDPSKNRFDRENKVAYLSKIFDWYSEDFEAHSGTILDYVRRFVADPQLAQELADSSYTIRFLDYDWNLNGIPPKEVMRARPS